MMRNDKYLTTVTAYHIQSEESVELDEAVEVAEHNRERQVHDVAWVAPEETPELDYLGEAKHEDKLSNQERLPSGRVKIRCCLPQCERDERVHDEGE